MKMRSEQSWSLLDPKPVLLYLNNLDEYIVYWNGIATTHLMALNLAMEYYGIFPTPEMKSAMEKNYSRIYYANGFETRAWDLMVAESPIYPYTKKLLADHCKTLLDESNRDISEVLSWFDYKRARQLDKKPV
jgi:hypothetical protein